MWYVNAVLTRVFDVLLWPFGRWPAGGLVFISLLTGVAMLLIFKYTSNQERIRQSKDVVRAHILAMRLFPDDARVVLASQRAALRANGNYLRWAALPILFIFPPVVLIMGQLNLRYGSRPVGVGETTVVTAAFKDAVADDARLVAPPGVVVETDACRVPYMREASWRVRGERPGTYRLRVVLASGENEKELVVGEGAPRRVSPRKTSGWWGQLLYPGEPPTKGPVREIRVKYEGGEVAMGPVAVSWVWVFFLASLAAAFALKGVFGAEV